MSDIKQNIASVNIVASNGSTVSNVYIEQTSGNNNQKIIVDNSVPTVSAGQLKRKWYITSLLIPIFLILVSAIVNHLLNK